jgi:FkbM family methyltransferase
MALSDCNGEVVFHKIDRQRTRTSWADGNPGASSLFLASGKYDGIEAYVQEAITVPAATAARLIEDKQITSPDLVWMDVQGAELLVLRGFASHLSSVKAIYVELSLQAIYSGQALAQEVLDFLERDFCWVKVANTGAWQFDALFVRRDIAGLRGSLRDLRLRSAMRIPGKPGIAVDLTRPKLSALLGTGVSRVADGVRARRTPAINDYASSIFRMGTRSPSPRLSHASRMLFEASLPSDPLAGKVDLPAIDLIIACHPKDAAVLPLAIVGAQSSSRNVIDRIFVVAPDSHSLLDMRSIPGVEVVDERELLPEPIVKIVRRVVPRERQGWVIQQLVKFQASLASEKAASLILDADTVLLRRRTFLDHEGRQILSVSHERHDPYVRHARTIWSVPNRPSISFVTHHQLMQRDIVESMFGADGSGLAEWLSTADWQQQSAVSEYHSYGIWLTTEFPGRALLASWGNVAVPSRSLPDGYDDVGLQYRRVRDAYPKAWSLSAHAYLT